MATYGSFNTSGYKFPSGDRYLIFNWEVTSQSIENNTTTIKWELIGAGTYQYNPVVSDIRVVIDDDVVYDKPNTYHVNVRIGDVVASGTKIITHDDDGTRSFVAFAEAGIYMHDANCSGTGTFVLETIPRKSSLSVNNGTLGTAQTLTVTQKSKSFTHTITYECGSAKGTICTKSSETSISWTPPLDLASQNTTGTSVPVTFAITTYNGNQDIGTNTKTITCVMPASVKPSCSIAVIDPLGYADIYGGYIKGLSKFEVVITATPSFDSGIVSYNATANDAKYTKASFTTEVVQIVGSQDIVATVTDKRGRNGSDTETVTVLDYSAPIITSLSVHRCNEDGTENDQGEYVKVIFSGNVTAINNKNTAQYTVEYKKTADSNYTSAVLTDLNNNYSVTNASFIFEADTGSSYDVRVTVADAFYSASKSTSASTGFTLMHWKADGTAMAIGKVAEKSYTLDMGLDVELNDNEVYKNGEIAFAPYGFGYGGKAVLLKNDSLVADEADLEVELAKIYDAMVAGETKMITFIGYPSNSDWRWFGVLSKSSANNGSLVAHSAYGRGAEIVKTKYGGAWHPCEWENPFLSVGVEYRTTERYRSKPVYVKVIEFGALPNNTHKSIAHGLTKTGVTSLAAVSTDGKYYFPSTSNTESVHLYINASYITMTVTGDWSSVSANVIVKYTKD